jgi:hypothetical protein
MSKIQELKDKKFYFSKRLTITKKEIVKIKNEIRNIDKLIHEEKTTKPLVVSDHAVIRILERRYGLEDTIKNVIEVLLRELEGSPHNCKKRIDDNLVAIIKGGRVCSVVPYHNISLK